MLVLINLLACAAEDSAPVIDTTCAFGPTLSILTPQAGDVLPVGTSFTVTAETSSPNDDVSTVVWAVTGLDGEAAGLSDTLGAGTERPWTPAAVGTWRITAQADDTCTLDPAYEVDGTQVEIEVTVE